MDRNVGNQDRVVRNALAVLLAIAGMAAIGGFWAGSTVVGAVMVVMGAVLVVTATTQRCLIYAGAGIDTCETEG